MKTVIHVLTHTFNINQEHLNRYNYLHETNFYFGLGDLLRSSIKLYNLSKIMQFKLIIDIQLHPMAAFLEVEKHEYSDYVLANKNNVDYVCYGAVEEYINTHSDTDIMLILTNDFYNDEDISNDCKEFIKKIFTPNNTFKLFIQHKLNSLPFPTFNILHYRVSDNEFLKKGETLMLEQYLDHLKKHKEYNDILITDTKKLKNYIFLNDDIFIFDTKICHLGLSTEPDEIRDTMFEFFLLTHASKIKTYCKIHSISGFIKWTGKIYDIPVIGFNY